MSADIERLVRQALDDTPPPPDEPQDDDDGGGWSGGPVVHVCVHAVMPTPGVVGWAKLAIGGVAAIGAGLAVHDLLNAWGSQAFGWAASHVSMLVLMPAFLTTITLSVTAGAALQLSAMAETQRWRLRLGVVAIVLAYLMGVFTWGVWR
jgi:hypothetical protein